ncbi:uncharacterized protein [Ptychodera flava]|uniref:uncharacterized protein n=1 Tax=Ptychodera flava TaxID=63121 RepID=UPI00396A1DD2
MGIQSSHPISGGAETTDFSSDNEYFPLPNKRHLLYRPIVLHVDTAVPKAVPVNNCFYVGQSSCMSDFMENINRTSHCRTDGCSGILILVKVTTAGLGGSLKIDYSCNGCTGRNISFDSSIYIEGTRRTIVSLALHLAHFIAGNHFSDISKSLGVGLGIQVLSRPAFQGIIKLLYPHVKNVVDEMCDEARKDMKTLPPTQIGSWQRAMTTSDGAWLTRGSFSKNFTFTVRNFMNNSLLYYLHLCQRGNDDIDDTLKAMLLRNASSKLSKRK